MGLEHFQEKWKPVFRPQPRTKKIQRKFMLPSNMNWLWPRLWEDAPDIAEQRHAVKLIFLR
jgi:hypothetical protein